MEAIIVAVSMMLLLGAILGVGLGIADKFLSVEVDERIEKVSSMLPNYNCGSCGFPGCAGLAEALVNGDVKVVSTCKPCKPDQKEAIAEYLNASVGPDGTTLKVKA